MRRALITGITGQDGSYLAEYLLERGYQVYGLVRGDGPTSRWLQPIRERIECLYGDLRDAGSLSVALQKAWPDELYNLAGQSFVPASWQCAAETFDVNVGGLARILAIVDEQKPDTRVYQASSSGMFGRVTGPCHEETAARPTTPYGVSKLAAHRLCHVYRERGLYVVSGILFNHESPRRGPEMVTRKITRAAARWALGDRSRLRLGNLDARRDWGFAGDYVKAMPLMLAHPVLQDYVIGTGQSHSVREFVAQALAEVRRLCPAADLPTEVDAWVEPDVRLHRPGEVQDLRADASRAWRELGWRATVGFPELVRMMVTADLAALAPETSCVGAGAR